LFGGKKLDLDIFANILGKNVDIVRVIFNNDIVGTDLIYND